MNILLHGYAGKMGRMIAQAAGDSGHTVAAGVDYALAPAEFPTFTDLKDCAVPADVFIDFTRPDGLGNVLAYCLQRKLPVVICTTGFTPAQVECIRAASADIPVFRSANMSLGVNLLAQIIARVAPILAEHFDIEIVERHHNQKVDSPSGTALMLADAVNQALSEPLEYTFGRHGGDAKREPRELGIHAIRGGTVVGEHDVLFLGPDEVIEIRHSAHSRLVFAYGALKAAQFLVAQKPGLYEMADLMRL